jgi:DNA uptake protein ComE-like DNA-binding protein
MSDRQPRQALVLVLVLIVVMMIALAGFSFAELMLTENKATHLHGDVLRMQQAIASGVEHLKLFCEQPTGAQDAAGGSYDNPELFRSISLRPEVRTAQLSPSVSEPRFSVVVPVAGLQGEMAARFGVENESARLHLADVLRFDEQQPGAARYALMQLPGMTEQTADAVLDWIDADSEPRAQGAENEYYAGLPQPYAVRNKLPESLTELLLVKGVTRELLFGADRNYNRVVEPDELASEPQSSKASGLTDAVPWSWLLTVHSGQRNMTSEGQPRIDLNGPNLPQLQQQLAAVAGADVAAFVIAYRQHGPYSGSDSATAGVPAVDVSAPAQFKLSSLLDLVGARVAVAGKGSDKSKVYASPLQTEPQTARAQLEKLEDATTTMPHRVTRGLVSVNHAPAVVLRAVPGIDDSLAQQIVAARDVASAVPSPQRRFATWLWFEGLVDLETMKRLAPFVSGGGDVVRAQVVAQFEQKQLAARAEVVIDATSKPARVLQWRDLRFHGMGFPPAWFASDAPNSPRN